MSSLQQIKQKLSVQNTDLRYNYLINNVCMGIKYALEHKKIIKDEIRHNKLRYLYKIVNKLPQPIFRDIDLYNQLTAYHIGLDALEIIEEID